MKKNRFILILTLVLSAIAAFFIYKNNSSSIRKEERDFAVKDTASITKIFLADRSGNAVTLERQPDRSWTVNKKFKVRKEGIKILLGCISNVSVQTRISRAGYNNVIKELSTTGIKCEIYVNNNEKPLKVYYVGGSTQDVLGTYMMLENSTVPFVTEVPGFEGYLTPRYSTIEKDWKETKIASYNVDEIKSVSILYNTQAEQSFTIEKTGNIWTVSSPISGKRIENPDTTKIKMYLTYFRNLNFEAWDHNFSAKQTDSLRHAVPATVLTIIDVKGNKTVLPMYPKPISATSMVQTDSTGRTLKYDLDRMYGFINDGGELVTLQYFVFGKLFVSMDEFDLNKRKSVNHQAHP